MDRFGKLLLGVLAVAVVAIGSSAFLATRATRRGAAGENNLGNPTGMSDRLDLIDTREAFDRGRRERVAVRAGQPATLVLDGGGETFPRTGTWTSAEATTDFAFTELLPSWNVSAPPETGLRLEVRARVAKGKRWTPWLYLGSWGKTSPAAKKVLYCRFGSVNVDYLALTTPADAYQVRVVFESFSLDASVAPSLRRVAVCYSGVTGLQRAGVPADGWVRDLGVPFHTQKDAPKALSGEICSPTSVTMVLGYWGVEGSVVENALAIWDGENQMFGNWGRAVSRAAELGMDAWLTRFRTWDEVKAQVAAGQPIIASIRFKKGTFPSAVLPSTGGHLIVVRGFTAAGDVIVNDPASRERGNGAVYRADELARAWFDHGGVGYVIKRPRDAGGTRPSAHFTFSPNRNPQRPNHGRGGIYHVRHTPCIAHVARREKESSMPQGRKSESSASTDGSDSNEPVADTYTSTPGAATSKGGPGNWGVAARWFMFALLAIAFFVCLKVVF